MAKSIKPKKEVKRKIKTTITWDKELFDDVVLLAELSNRNVSNYIETQMLSIREKSKAAGLI